MKIHFQLQIIRKRIVKIGFLIAIVVLFNFFYSSFVKSPTNTHPTVAYVEEKFAKNAVEDFSWKIGTSFPIYVPSDSSINLITHCPVITETAAINEKDEMIIGTSVDGLPLEVYKFGNGPNQRMIVAGIHGGYEWNTVVLVDELIQYIRKNPELVPENVTLYILRNLNPDGYIKSFDIYGRANANGVDLNRNWNANWQIDWNRDACFNQVHLTSGNNPESEPEVYALAEFIRIHNLEAVINYHSAGLGIFAGGNPPTQSSISLAKALSQVSDYRYPPQDNGCVYTGQFIDWAAESGIAAVDLELSTHTDLDLEINKDILGVFLNWNAIIP